VQAGGVWLEIPNMFLDCGRLILASNFPGRRTLSRRDHKVVAYNFMAQDIKESSSDQVDINQSIWFPFQVDGDFCADVGPGWELQVFNNECTGRVLAEEEIMLSQSRSILQCSKKHKTIPKNLIYTQRHTTLHKQQKTNIQQW
jgi:hypothetical protein